MLIPQSSNRFENDLKKAKKRNKDFDKFKEVLKLLIEEKPLSPKLKDHALTGEYKDFRECHIEPDWLLIYQKDSENIYLARIGSHSDLFD